MDKKKVEELIENTLRLISVTDGFSEDDDENLEDIELNLEDIKAELSKSDWMSVEDGLPNWEEDVEVCNENEPGEIWFSHRSNESWVETDAHGFTRPINCFPITHWRKTEKLQVRK